MLKQQIEQPQFNFILRQLAALMDNGKSYQQAFNLLYEAANENDKKHLLKIDGVIKLPPEKINSCDFMSLILKAIKQENGDSANFLRFYQQMLSHNPFTTKTYWISIYTMLGYASFLLFFAITCFTIFSMFVFPQFQHILDHNGAALPKFSAFIFSNSQIITALMSVAFLVLLATIAYLNLNVQKNMASMIPLTGFIPTKLMMRSVSRKYNKFLLCNYAKLLHKSGININKSLHLASEMIYSSVSKNNASEIDANLQLSLKLNTLEQELDFQESQHPSDVIESMVKFADRFSMISKPLLYVVLGSLIISMYLPIFTLGSVGAI